MKSRAIIVFHSLTREDIRAIVNIQLDRVVRTAAAQRINVEIDSSLVEHLVETGYQPQYGASELKRQIRLEVETALAKALLGETFARGDMVRLAFDPVLSQVSIAAVDVVSTQKTKKAKKDDHAAHPA